MVQDLVRMVSSVNDTAAELSKGASEISKGNAELRARTETQAAALQNAASSMVEITSIVKNNAESAQKANQLAAGASTDAEAGGIVVSNAVVAMTAINTSSRKIASIISVIDDIAFQTNLLALNAAVEAARAGEQGRRFAVVASEVPVLAQRSSEAASEISELINDSVQKVNDGAELVDQSGQTLHKIVESIKKSQRLFPTSLSLATSNHWVYKKLTVLSGTLTRSLRKTHNWLTRLPTPAELWKSRPSI